MRRSPEPLTTSATGWKTRVGDLETTLRKGLDTLQPLIEKTPCPLHVVTPKDVPNGDSVNGARPEGLSDPWTEARLRLEDDAFELLSRPRSSAGPVTSWP